MTATQPSVFVIGDSISVQYGPYLERALAGRWTYTRKAGESEALKNLDIPAGSNGGDSGMVMAYLRARAEHSPIDTDVLLVNCGLHDIKTTPGTSDKQVPLPKYEQYLRQIIDIVRKMRPTLVWVRTTPCDEAVHNSRPGMTFHRFRADCDAYNAAADRIMAAAGVPSIDLYHFTLSLGPERELYCDHAHYHEPIRQQQGAFIAGWLEGWRSGKGCCGAKP